jgi:tetratricopeptide (TPR) repeat protein
MFFQNSSDSEDRAALRVVIEKGVKKAEQRLASEKYPDIRGSFAVQLAFVQKKLGNTEAALALTPEAAKDFDTEKSEEESNAQMRIKKLEENKFIQFLYQAGDVARAKKRLTAEAKKARLEKILGPGMLRDLADTYIVIEDTKTASALLHEAYLREKEEIEAIPTKDRSETDYTGMYLCLLALTDLGEDAFVEPRVGPLSQESRAMILRNKARRLLGKDKPTLSQQAAALPFLDKSEKLLTEYSAKNKKEASVGYYIPLLILWHRAGRPERAKSLLARLPQVVPPKNKAERAQFDFIKARVCAATGDVPTAIALIQKTSAVEERFSQYLEILNNALDNSDMAGYKMIEKRVFVEAEKMDKENPGLLAAMKIVLPQTSSLLFIEKKQYKEATKQLKDFENVFDSITFTKPSETDKLGALLDILVKLAVTYAKN